MSGHVPKAVPQLQAIARLPSTTNLDLALGFPLRNREALTNLLEQLYDPSSSLYHQFLSVGEFTEKFCATEADYQAAIEFARSNGLAITGIHPNRMLLDVRGSVDAIEKTFHTTLRVYRHPTEARTFFAPDLEPSVPSGVPIQDLSGLDNFAPPRPMDLRRKNTDGTVIVSNATGSGPGGDFMGKDFRAAYAPGVTNDGSGQTIGLFEFGPYYTNDIYMYQTNAGLPTSITISNILLDGVSGIPSGSSADDGEETLDIDMAMAMAPGATILVYEGNNGNDIFNRMATDNLAKQMSCSFGYSPMPASTEQIFQQYAAQGQSMFVASGDGGAYPPAPGAMMPQSEDPYLTIVGGTTLTTSGAGGRWVSESTWGGSGGGTSTRWGIPSWQAGVNMQVNGGSTTFRNIPDVAMLADTVIFWVFKNGTTGTVGGTSAAAPLWAGFTALINQEAAVRGQRSIGFLNPAAYRIGKGTASLYRTIFHDVTTGNNGRFNAVSGYDLCTGWGSPTGSNTINALVGTGTNDFALYATPGLPSLVPGGTVATLLSVVPMAGFSGTISLSVSALPAGVTSSLSSTSTTTSSVLTLTSSSSALAGTYPFTVTGTSGGISHPYPFQLILQPSVPGETRVSLSGIFNRAGIYADGSKFSSGADGVGFAYPASLLGPATSWNELLFGIGPANGLNIVGANSQSINLPTGQYTTLQVLAAAVNGNQLNQTFTVTYTDNSTDTFTQSLSDWASPSSLAGESIAVRCPYRNSGNGTRDGGTAVNVYGYCFTLNTTKTVKSLRLPANPNDLILAVALAKAPAPLQITSLYNRAGFFTDGTKFASNSGLDNGGSGYSVSWLGGAQLWNGTLFKLGSANNSNAVSCAGQNLTVPPGQYVALRMLATGVQGNQTAQSIVFSYSDGTSNTAAQSFSDWFTPQNYPGESKAVPTGYRNISTGSKDNRLFYLYGYSVPINSAKVLQSVTLPNNPNVELLGLTLAPDWAPSFLENPFTEPGLAVGQPVSGTIATNAIDQNSDVLTFAKISGPAWLTVAGDGSLSGAPAPSDIGTNSFVVSATDPGGLSANANLFIQVSSPEPLTISISISGGSPLLNWSGGAPPYQVETTTNLSSPVWQPLGPPVNANSLPITPVGTSAFYRVVGQ